MIIIYILLAILALIVLFGVRYGHIRFESYDGKKDFYNMDDFYYVLFIIIVVLFFSMVGKGCN